jgi:hypothetical protein
MALAGLVSRLLLGRGLAIAPSFGEAKAQVAAILRPDARLLEHRLDCISVAHEHPKRFRPLGAEADLGRGIGRLLHRDLHPP